MIVRKIGLVCLVGTLLCAPPLEAMSGDSHKISGEFEVSLTSKENDALRKTGVNSMMIEKLYHGPLRGSAKGLMIAARGQEKGSAGYVAMERVSATLEGKTGYFTLQHSGTMAGGNQSLIINVVPDSGSGDLQGIAGAMKIRVEDGKHYYDFEYWFAAQP